MNIMKKKNSDKKNAATKRVQVKDLPAGGRGTADVKGGGVAPCNRRPGAPGPQRSGVGPCN